MKLLTLSHPLRHQPAASPHWLEQFNSPGASKRVVKKDHYSEPYQRTKLASSVHRACAEASGFIGEAELTAERVCHEVEAWLENKYEVTTADLRRQAASALKRYNPVAAYAYAYAPVKEYRVNRDEYGFVRL